MVRKREYSLLYDAEIARHVGTIDRRHHSLIRAFIEEQLRFEPLTETRNRKPLMRPAASGATWELRFGPNNRFRVYYRVDSEAQAVLILAIGEKQHERVYVGGEEYPR